MSRSFGLLSGALAPLRGFALLGRYPKLWRVVALAVITQILLTAVFLIGWVWLSLRWLTPEPGASFWSAALHWAGAGAVALIGILVSAAAGTLLGMLLNPLAYTRLAEETERVLGGDPKRFQAVGAVRQVWEAVGSGGEFVLVNALLLAAGFLPGAAPAVAVASFVYDAWFLGRMCLEFPQVMRGLRLDARRSWARRNWGLTVGLGSGVVLWSAVPVVGSVLTAAAVVGATELVRGGGAE